MKSNEIICQERYQKIEDLEKQHKTWVNGSLCHELQPRDGYVCSSWQTPDEAVAIAAVKEAYKLSVNFFDTAPFYGSGKAEMVNPWAVHSL